MNNLEEEYLTLLFEFKKGNSRVFGEIWNKACRMIDYSKYFDPTGARGREDFEAIAMGGLLKGLESYDIDRGGNIISWLRTQMHQSILKELKKIGRELHPLNTDSSERGEDTDKLTFEERFFREIKNGINYTSVDDPEELYRYYVELMENKLYKVNKRALEVFKIKIANPGIMHKEIAKLMNITSTRVSWLVLYIENEYKKLKRAGVFAN